MIDRGINPRAWEGGPTHQTLADILMAVGMVIGVFIILFALAGTVGPADAWVGDCGDPPCGVNGSFPTPMPLGTLPGALDMENDTYLRYWFNYSAPYDFPWIPIAYSATLPFTLTMGSWFYVIIWFLYLGMLYLRAQDPIPVLIIGILSATVMGAFFPPEAYPPIILLFAAAAVGIMIRVFKERI